MPANRITMRRIREVLRLKHECGLPNARIAAALGIAKGEGAKMMGKLMGPVMGKVKGLAEGNEVRALVQEFLN